MRRGWALAVLAAVVAVPSAAAQTVRVDWRESYYPDYPRSHRITFRVARIEAHGSGWTVHAGFTNRTPWRLRIDTNDPTGWIFGLATASRQPAPPGTFGSYDRFRARRFQPPLPATLGPGESWSGRFGAPGKLPRARPLRVSFGIFLTPPRTKLAGRKLLWITDGSFRL